MFSCQKIITVSAFYREIEGVHHADTRAAKEEHVHTNDAGARGA